MLTIVSIWICIYCFFFLWIPNHIFLPFFCLIIFDCMSDSVSNAVEFQTVSFIREDLLFSHLGREWGAAVNRAWAGLRLLWSLTETASLFLSLSFDILWYLQKAICEDRPSCSTKRIVQTHQPEEREILWRVTCL